MSLEKTLLQNIRVNYPSRLDDYDNRVKITGLLTAVLEMNDSPSSIMTDDLRQKAVNSQGRTIEVPVIQRGNVTIKNARSCVVECTDSDSDLVEVVWKTVVADVCMVPGQFPINTIQYQQAFAKKIESVVEAFRLELEDGLETALDSNKSKVYSASSLVAPTGAKYALTGDAIRVPKSLQDLFFNDIDAINLSDDYGAGVLKILGNHTLMPTVREYMNQGSSNDKNRAFQFGNFDFSFSNGIPNGTGVASTGYFLPDGAIGFLTRLDVDSLNNNETTDGTRWFVDSLPGLPFPVGIKYDSTCSDQSALISNKLDHLTATKIEHWQISFDYATIVPYNRDIDTRPSPIRKFEFLNS